MEWLRCERVTQTKKYDTVLVYRSNIPEEWQMEFLENPRLVIEKIYNEIIDDENIPTWMHSCEEAIFPTIGMIFLGPSEVLYNAY